MSNAQLWYVLIAGTIILFMAVIMFADAVKSVPSEPVKKAFSSAKYAPYDVDVQPLHKGPHHDR